MSTQRILDPKFFPLSLDFRRTAPRMGVFEKPFVYLSERFGRREIEAGFDSDYASTPRFLWWLYPPDGEYSEGAFFHDHDYWYQTRPRADADAQFLECMAVLGVPWHRRQIIYQNVRLFGWKAWNDNARKRAAEEAATLSLAA